MLGFIALVLAAGVPVLAFLGHGNKAVFLPIVAIVVGAIARWNAARTGHAPSKMATIAIRLSVTWVLVSVVGVALLGLWVFLVLGGASSLGG